MVEFTELCWDEDPSGSGVVTITINRPERRNAISATTALELRQAWRRFESSTLRVAVLTGAGSAAFSSGADLDEPPRNVPCLPGAAVRVTKPVIAAISGWCVGLGLVLSQMCDLCVCDPSARFELPEVRIGKTGGSVMALAHRLPMKCAFELLLGEQVGAARAKEMGLINWVVDEGEHLNFAVTLARRIASYDLETIQWLKVFLAEMLPRSPGEYAEIVTSFMQHKLDGVDGPVTEGAAEWPI